MYDFYSRFCYSYVKGIMDVKCNYLIHGTGNANMLYRIQTWINRYWGVITTPHFFFIKFYDWRNTI